MQKRFLLPLCVLVGFLLVACGTTEVTVNRNDSTPAAAAKTSPAATPAAVLITTGEKIGVPECDDFLAAYDACVSSKVPEAARAQYKTTIEQWRTSWRRLAGNPETRASLVMACKTSAEQARVSMKSFDCTF